MIQLRKETEETQVASSEEAMDNILDLIDKYRERSGGLISMLQEIQGRFGYLPAEVLRVISKETSTPLVDIYGVATFYKAFSLKPRGEHLCSVCVGTACHVRGAPEIARGFEKTLGIQAGETTADKQFTLEHINCLGACALGPIVVVDGHYFSNVSKPQIEEIIDKTLEGLDMVEIANDRRVFPLGVSCARCNHSLMDPEHLVDGYPSIRVTIAFDQQHGWLRLSSLYGSHNTETEYEIPVDSVVHVFCPHCHAQLIGAHKCPECAAPMVPMILRQGGVLQICTRRGCRGHLLDLISHDETAPAQAAG